MSKEAWRPSLKRGGFYIFMDFSKIRWNRHFGTNDLCEIAIFQVIKVYFWGGMAVLQSSKLTMDN